MKLLGNRISSSAENKSTDEEIIGEELLEMIHHLRVDRDEARRDARRQFERVGKISPLADAAAQERSRREEIEKRLRDARNVQRASDDRLERFAAQVADRDSEIASLRNLNVELQDHFEKVDRLLVRKREYGWLALKGLAGCRGIVLAAVRGIRCLIVSSSDRLSVVDMCRSVAIGSPNGSRAVSSKDTYLADSKLYAKVRLVRNFWWAFAIAVAASLIAAWINESLL